MSKEWFCFRMKMKNNSLSLFLCVFKMILEREKKGGKPSMLFSDLYYSFIGPFYIRKERKKKSYICLYVSTVERLSIVSHLCLIYMRQVMKLGALYI